MLHRNVTVEELEDGSSLARIANSETLMAVGELRDDPILLEIAREARNRLTQAVAHLIAQ